MRRLTGAVGVVVAAAVMATGGCSSSGSKAAPVGPTSSQAPGSTTTTVAGPTAVAGTSISIKGFAFQPPELAAKVGDTISVTNTDGTDHSLTSVDGAFDTGRFSSGAKTFKVDKAGRFEFKCEVHSFMPHGFIQVSG